MIYGPREFKVRHWLALLAGLLIVGAFVRFELHEGALMRRPTVDGVIDRIGVEPAADGEGARITVRYRYEVEGRRLIGERWSWRSDRFESEAKARFAMRLTPKELPHSVYFDPENPGDSFLMAPKRPYVHSRLLMLGVFLLGWPVLGKREVKSGF